MIFVLAESSILLDLETVELLTPAFGCGHSIAISDLLYGEFIADGGPQLMALGLVVLDLTSAEMALAQVSKTQHLALALSDCFALICAARPQHALVTNNKILRTEAKARGIEAHHFRWMLDQISHVGNLGAPALDQALRKLSETGRLRSSPDDDDVLNHAALRSTATAE
jgi:hypothetical protein